MFKFTLIDKISNDEQTWINAISSITSVPSYEKFLRITSERSLVVVKNNQNFAEDNTRNQCHENCRKAEIEGKGKRVPGWIVLSEFTYKECAAGILRLVHHSNMQLDDGSYVNPTNNFRNLHHIFLPDEKRDYDFDKCMGYNDRMVFSDNFMVGRDFYKAVPRNRVLFTADDEFHRDLYYEKFTVHKSPEEVMADMPKGLSAEQEKKWITLKSTARFKV